MELNDDRKFSAKNLDEIANLVGGINVGETIGITVPQGPPSSYPDAGHIMTRLAEREPFVEVEQPDLKYEPNYIQITRT